MLTGQNGILNRAAEAKEKTEEAQKRENETLNEYEKTFNKYMSNLPSTKYTIPYLPDTNKFERVDGTDLSTGLVIKEKTTGSEYVWVEVPKTREVYKNAGLDISTFGENECNLIEKDLQDYTSEYRTQTNFKDEFFEDTSEGWFKNANEYNNAKYKMIKSVYENGGFWVGRYEAGIEKNRTEPGEAVSIPLSKENIYPYNYITRTQAKVLSEKVESGSYISSLLFGLQWDLIMGFIHNRGNVENEVIKGVEKSKLMGNYVDNLYNINNEKAKYSLDLGQTFSKCPFEKKLNSSVLLTTGANESFSQVNLYDVAGNVFEWTLENNNDNKSSCAYRGGNYINIGGNFSASSRNSFSINSSFDGVGFRVSIY